MRSLKPLRFLALFAFVAALAPACATAPPAPPDASGPRFRAAALSNTESASPAIGYPAKTLTVLLDRTVSDTTPQVSRYWYVGGGQNAIGLQLVTTGTLQGTWKVEVSCSPTAIDTYSTAPSTGSGPPTVTAVNDDASDITSAFSPTIASVTAASSQYVQAAPLYAGYIRATFTPTTGSGHARVNLRN